MVIQPVSGNGGIVPSGTIEITTNGTHNVAVYANAEVNVPASPAVLVTKNITENGTYNASSDSADGYSSVTVNVSGTTPTGTLPVTENGVYNCSAYANVDVDVPSTTSSVFGIEATKWAGMYVDDGYLLKTTLAGTPDFSNVVYIYTDYILNGAFYSKTGIIGVPDFSNCVSIIADHALTECFKQTNITGINFEKLVTIQGTATCLSMCYVCTALTSFNLKSLETIDGYGTFAEAFRGCTSLIRANFESLKTIAGTTSMQNCFVDCLALRSVWFYALETVTATSPFNYFLGGVVACNVHFPIAMQATLEQDPDIQRGMGGTGTIVSYDIVTSLTGADTNTYTRSQKNSTQTATAWKNNNVLYYTSGTSEPSVSDTIYSDAACTITVTTVSAIA